MLPSRLSYVSSIRFKSGRPGPVGASVTYHNGRFVALVADLIWTWDSMDEIKEVTNG